MAIPFTFKNEHIDNAMAKTWDVLGRYNAPYCSISGGSDSDVMLDLVYRMDTEKKVRYVWFNTGLEYEATKQHLSYLENEYNIEIIRTPATVSIPLAVKNYGQPFVSKFVSGCINQLQSHGFDFTVEHDYDDDIREYAGCQTAIGWWHNRHKIKMWNINYNVHLRDFLSLYPPDFLISNRCCHYSKKLAGERYRKENNVDLRMLGLRKTEGGIRQLIGNCISHSEKYGTSYRPIYWFNEKDKAYYVNAYGIVHSDCYTRYGMRRTGCVGCPYNMNVFAELKIIERFEPNLLKAAMSVFKMSYEYTRLFREYQMSLSPSKRFHFSLT